MRQSARRGGAGQHGVFRRRRVIDARDVDSLGHVNNAVWVRFVVELSHAHASARGFDSKRVRDLGGIWIVRRHEIDYHASALPGEELIEETWVRQMKGARSTRCCRFLRASDGTVLLESTTQWAFVDGESQRPRRIPRDLLDGFEPSEGPA